MNIFRKIWNWIVSIPKDKLLHDYVAALITLFTFALAFLGLGYWQSFVLANFVAIATLFGKSVYDYFHSEPQELKLGGFCWGCFGIFKVDIALLILAIVIA